jgi:hypothetical protein
MIFHVKNIIWLEKRMFFASEEKKYSTPPLKVIWSVPYLNLISMMFGSFVGVLISYLCYLCLLANGSVKHIMSLWVTWQVSYKRQELLTLREHLGSSPVFSEVSVFILLVLCVALCCVFCFVCLHPVSCMPNVASVSALSILNCPFGFLKRLFVHPESDLYFVLFAVISISYIYLFVTC